MREQHHSNPEGVTDETNMAFLIGGGAVMVTGIVVSSLGGKKMKRAMANYNSTLTFQPEFHFGATANGIGLAVVF